MDRVLAAREWRPLARAHEAQVDRRLKAHLQRRREGRRHPVEDFLFTYYRLRPAALRRWHPGAGVALRTVGADPDEVAERVSWRWYRVDRDTLALDLPTYLADRASTVRFVRDLLRDTASRSPALGCFGLHEWAMVYRSSPDELRHRAWPLRLGTAGTDQVVESHRIRCSHYDAFRFFTDDARPLNTLQPSRSEVGELEQPGCLHAGMDLYKWAGQLGPVVASDLLLECFDLAREIRVLDMRAAPYDLSGLTLDASGQPWTPVRIETAEGKQEYVAAQQSFARRAQVLRRRLVDACDAALATR